MQPNTDTATPFIENVPATAAAVLLFRNWTGHTLADLIDAGRVNAADMENDVTEPYAVRLDRFPDYIFPAISDPWNDWVTVDIADHFPNTEEGRLDAIHAANRWAEKWAEDSREFYAEEEARARLADIRTEVRELIADIRALCPALGERKAAAGALRDALQSLLSERSKLIQA